MSLKKHTVVTLIPNNEKLRQAVRNYGEKWEVIDYTMRHPSFRDRPAYFIQPVNDPDNRNASRWVEEQNLSIQGRL